MAINNQVNIEALAIKAFLYKYTPPFVAVPNSNVGQTSTVLSSFDAYSTILDDTQYFTKYDISDFVVSYSFEQNINETTYGWSLELQDLALSYSIIDTKLKVKPINGTVGSNTTGLSFSTSTNSIQALSTYELDSDTDNSIDLNIVKTAKELRGTSPASLTSQDVNLNGTLPNIPGLRLSDLIQEYDFVSLFLYKNSTPISSITGAVVVQNGYPVFVPVVSGGRSLVDADLQNETVLLSKQSNGLPLFSNEFNGYVMKKSFVSAINQVDRIVLNGNGWTRLFGCTRRVTKPSLFQGSLYQQGQLLSVDDVSATTTVFAGKPISSIVQDLFDLLYRIDFKTVTNTVLSDSFFNISSLITSNSTQLGPSNLFTIPQYLLASVMERRNFTYQVPQNPITFPSQISAEFPNVTQIPADAFQRAVTLASGQIINASGTVPVLFSSDVQNLTAYFQFLDEVFRNFSPDLKTPYEILDEIRNITFIELFETHVGQFLIRSPQYNNTNIYDPTQPTTDLNRSDINMVLSSSLNVISSNYSETVENLITKLFTGYSAQFQPTIPGLEQFAYCDGKLLTQFGLMESTTEANPNVNLQTSSDNSVNNSKTTGLFEYARYLMRILDARLKIGTVVCNLDTTIQVGHTYFDQTRYKFGYINSITKQASITGTATMTLGLTYVRDAVPSSVLTQGSVSTGISAATTTISSTNSLNIQVPSLPILTDIEKAFSGS